MVQLDRKLDLNRPITCVVPTTRWNQVAAGEKQDGPSWGPSGSLCGLELSVLPAANQSDANQCAAQQRQGCRFWSRGPVCRTQRQRYEVVVVL
jgi:hypothetical protein